MVAHAGFAQTGFGVAVGTEKASNVKAVLFQSEISCIDLINALIPVGLMAAVLFFMSRYSAWLSSNSAFLGS